MKILAIETSCDETAASVVANGREICSSIIASQVSEHALYGGVVPEIASRRHVEQISAVVASALKEAATTPKELDAIAVTAGPGLIGALLVGVNFAKGLSYANSLPLVPVHHLRGHIAANYLAYPELKPPFLCLVVSGGHSHIVAVDDYCSFRVLGRTSDDAAGEAYDKVARILGFPYPGGIHIDKLAVHGNPTAFRLPTPKTQNPFDFSFSGLKTAVVNLAHNMEQKSAELPAADIAASFQHTVVQILTNTFLHAAETFGYTTLVCAGGVAANTGLRQMLTEQCMQKKLRLFLPPPALCGDNAAMIGAQAFYEYQNGQIAPLNLNAYATFEITKSFV